MEISVTMETESSIFEFDEKSMTVNLRKNLRSQVLSGYLCPEEDQVTLSFNIKSDLLGHAVQNITFPV